MKCQAVILMMIFGSFGFHSAYAGIKEGPIGKEVFLKEMNMAVAMKEPANMTDVTPLSEVELSRIESLGDNCELGFVMRNLGYEKGGLFRWAATTPEVILKALKDDLKRLYVFENLVPLHPYMLDDTAYGIGWHSRMKSEDVSGKLTFTDSEEVRRGLYAKEAQKVAHLKDRFGRRATTGGAIYVVKSNKGIKEETLVSLEKELEIFTNGRDFTLLEVQATDNPAKWGTFEKVSQHRVCGYIHNFGAYGKNAEDLDMKSWTLLLKNVLNAYPAPHWERAFGDSADSRIVLPFPPSKHDNLGEPIAGDLRAGTVLLENPVPHSRQVGGAFRLHGKNPGQTQVALLWLGVRGKGNYTLKTTLKRPSLENGIPVRAILRGIDGAGVPFENAIEISDDAPVHVSMPISLYSNPARIEIFAEASRGLRQGEMAVVDVNPPQLVFGK